MEYYIPNNYKINQQQFQKAMQYFLYVPLAPLVNSVVSEESQNFCYQPTNVSVYTSQEFFFTPNFSNSQLGFSDLPYFQPNQNYATIEQNSLLNPDNDANQTKLRKKRQRNTEKQIESAKKNGESNLINQFFSFFNCRQKSQKTVQAAIHSLKKEFSYEKLSHLFYNTIHVVNTRRGRNYVNKKILLSLFKPQELLKVIPEMKDKIQKVSDISLQDLCILLRKCCNSFFRTSSIDSILSSKRITSIAKQQHFKRRRKIVRIINGQQ